MHLISRFKISTWIILLTILPITALVILGMVVVRENLGHVHETRDQLALVNISPAISAVVHELQKERGLSAGFLGSHGSQEFADLLPEQYERTDGAISNFQDEMRAFFDMKVPMSVTDRFEAAAQSVAELVGGRESVLKRRRSPSVVIKSYSDTNADLISIISHIGFVSTDERVTKAITTYIAILEAKERAGRERAIAAAAFAIGQFAPDDYLKFVRVVEGQDIFFSIFNIYASQEQRQFMHDTLDEPVVARYRAMRKIALESAQVRGMSRVKAKDWYDTTTARINLLKRVEDRVRDDLRRVLGVLNDTVTTEYWLALILLPVVIAVIFALCVAIIGGIKPPLESLARDMLELADGKTNVDLTGRNRTDEIGGMVRALEVFRDTTLERDRAEEELRAAKDAAEQSLEKLKQTQEQLVQSEKMASLGQLTAGIAHEIKNPLNFVNNFSEVSIELLDELNEALEPVAKNFNDDTRDDIDDLIDTLKGDLSKVHHHGKRADAIVKSMLLHARGDSTDRKIAEVNALVEEALQLAYHGERARDKSFTATMEHNLDAEAGNAEVVPQDIIRVLVNIFSNAFYAVKQRVREHPNNAYEPRISVATSGDGETVEIRVSDNGVGIPLDIKEQLFNPFFTTKPTNEGTGLGLSMTYDIIVKVHGGQIDVTSEINDHTEFCIRLPRRMRDSVEAEA